MTVRHITMTTRTSHITTCCHGYNTCCHGYNTCCHGNYSSTRVAMASGGYAPKPLPSYWALQQVTWTAISSREVLSLMLRKVYHAWYRIFRPFFPEFSRVFPEISRENYIFPWFKSRVPNFLIFQVFTFPPSFGWNLPSAPQWHQSPYILNCY